MKRPDISPSYQAHLQSTKHQAATPNCEAILAIFTAVVSENMITTVENRREKRLGASLGTVGVVFGFTVFALNVLA